MMEAALALLFGLLIGSFLNVCIYRWPRDLSVVRPRSHCPACEKTIAWYDNVPLGSFVILGGRCRHCRACIPWRYPAVELATALAWFYWIYTDGLTVLGGKMCVLSALCIGLIFTDLEERILPDEMTLGGAAIGFLFAWFVTVDEVNYVLILGVFGLRIPERFLGPAESLFSALVPAFFLWLGGWIYEKIRHREGLGLGDVKLIAMVGAFLGLQAALFTLLAGCIGGLVIGYPYIKLTGKDTATYELPFGTFLGLAALAAALGAH